MPDRHTTDAVLRAASSEGGGGPTPTIAVIREAEREERAHAAKRDAGTASEITVGIVAVVIAVLSAIALYFMNS